jgi:hypothetical protein
LVFTCIFQWAQPYLVIFLSEYFEPAFFAFLRFMSRFRIALPVYEPAPPFLKRLRGKKSFGATPLKKADARTFFQAHMCGITSKLKF